MDKSYEHGICNVCKTESLKCCTAIVLEVKSQIHNNKSWCEHAGTCLTGAWCSSTWMVQAIVVGHAQYLTYSQPHARLMQSAQNGMKPVLT